MWLYIRLKAMWVLWLREEDFYLSMRTVQVHYWEKFRVVCVFQSQVSRSSILTKADSPTWWGCLFTFEYLAKLALSFFVFEPALYPTTALLYSY